jgi:hypothetical protein
MIDPPHCLHRLLSRLCSQMLAPPHSLHTLWRLCSQMLPRRIAFTCFFGGCARRCSTRRIACGIVFLRGCARRSSENILQMLKSFKHLKDALKHTKSFNKQLKMFYQRIKDVSKHLKMFCL